MELLWVRNQPKTKPSSYTLLLSIGIENGILHALDTKQLSDTHRQWIKDRIQRLDKLSLAERRKYLAEGLGKHYGKAKRTEPLSRINIAQRYDIQ